MKLLRKPAAVAVAALALTALSATTAQAHDGEHPFKNCTEAYENGYSDISKGDEHYADDLDRDQDGIGCDQPPADFVPAEDQGTGDGGTEDTSSDDEGQDTGQKATDLAKTGGSGATPYIAAGGAVVLLAGGGVLFTVRKRRDAR
ncbi:LAETG motif-containing sortase-dependent surface protein [Streptomyces sp. NBC_00878]|uniref:LAETG motif-containing sortase-dependent surface protein n=1 Tax=Streptomyces sp. NBC_00878 TaxID=2975854 RepID=UPI00224EADF1|nr:LAETG motif-containing sortase-dependent surface protein [Streptomyces sp. NBC_00878]MCX4908846.1 excalibur calcium-binding domain-containing protein [Streptomyces sp. NBC_00878]